MRILDLGCGQVPKLISNYLEIEVVNCDSRPAPGVDVQDMEKLTYPDNSFDAVICINALDHTKNVKAVLAEIERVIKPEGWVYINCALDQLTRHGKKHYWDVKADGRFVNPFAELDIKDFGFIVESSDGRMEARTHG